MLDCVKPLKQHILDLSEQLKKHQEYHQDQLDAFLGHHRLDSILKLTELYQLTLELELLISKVYRYKLIVEGTFASLIYACSQIVPEFDQSQHQSEQLLPEILHQIEIDQKEKINHERNIELNRVRLREFEIQKKYQTIDFFDINERSLHDENNDLKRQIKHIEDKIATSNECIKFYADCYYIKLRSQDLMDNIIEHEKILSILNGVLSKMEKNVPSNSLNSSTDRFYDFCESFDDFNLLAPDNDYDANSDPDLFEGFDDVFTPSWDTPVCLNSEFEPAPSDQLTVKPVYS